MSSFAISSKGYLIAGTVFAIRYWTGRGLFCHIIRRFKILEFKFKLRRLSHSDETFGRQPARTHRLVVNHGQNAVRPLVCFLNWL